MPSLIYTNHEAGLTPGAEGTWSSYHINQIQQTIRQEAHPGRESFFPSLWGRAQAIDERLSLALKQEPMDLEALRQDPDLCAWLAIHRALATTPNPQARAGRVFRGEQGLELIWPDEAREALPRALASVFELAAGEEVPFYAYQLTKEAGAFAGRWLMLGIGIPAKIRKDLKLRHLDFLPMQPGAYAGTQRMLWEAASRSVDFIDAKGQPIPWSETKRDKDHHLLDLARTLARLDVFDPLILAIQGSTRRNLSAQGAPHPLDRIPFVELEGRRIYLHTASVEGPKLLWAPGTEPKAGGAIFLGEGVRGTQIQVGDRIEPAEWVALPALFADQALDFHTRLSNSEVVREKMRCQEHADLVFEDYLPLTPMAIGLFPEEVLEAFGKQFGPSDDGSALVLKAKFEVQETHGGQPTSLDLEFQVRYQRILGSDRNQICCPATRKAKLSLALFPSFCSESWSHYFLHAAAWEGMEGITLEAHPGLGEGRPAPLPVSATGPVLHRLEFRPGSFSLRNREHSLGLFRPRLTPMEVADACQDGGSDNEVHLAIDLGSANTTIAARWSHLPGKSPDLIDLDPRKLYAERPLVEFEPARDHGLSLVARQDATTLERTLKSHWATQPRRRSLGVPHLRAIRTYEISDAPKATLVGYRRSPWLCNTQLALNLAEDHAVGQSPHLSLPTQAASQTPLTEQHQSFRTLFPVLERGMACHASDLEAVLGRPLRAGAQWELVQDLKWGGSRTTSGTNLKATYLSDLVILACAHLCIKARRTMDPKKVRLTLTFPYGQEQRLLTTIRKELHYDIAGRVSESEANYRYLRSKTNQDYTTNASAFTLIMDMGGSTTDFSLVHQGEIKSYASLGQFTSKGRRRFFGGLALVDMIGAMPASGGLPASGGRETNLFTALNDLDLTGEGRDLSNSLPDITAMLNSRMPELRLDSRDIRIRLHLLAYAICHFGSQLILHHYHQMPERPERLTVNLWLPGSGWKLMRLAVGHTNQEWTEDMQHKQLRRIFELAFRDACQLAAHGDLRFEILGNDTAVPYYATVAKSSVVLGALMPAHGEPEQTRSVPYGISLANATMDPEASKRVFTSWDPARKEVLASWLEASKASGLVDGGSTWDDPANVWNLMTHPFQPFGQENRLKAIAEGLFQDKALRDRFLAPMEGQQESRFLVQLRHAHVRATEELREIIRANPEGEISSPLAYYLEALSQQLFQPEPTMLDLIGRDSWDKVTD